MKINIIQFWDKKALPEEINTLINSWREDINFSHSLYNRASASEFIRANFGKDAEDVFNICGIPAMQADFFRYCALFVFGGCYLDADTERLGRLSDLIDGRIGGLLMRRKENIANDFMFVSAPSSCLLEYCIEAATSNIKNRISNNVWEVTGPGIMTAAYQGLNREKLFYGFEFMPVQKVRLIVGFRHNLEYKKSMVDWRIAQNSKSIFIEKI